LEEADKAAREFENHKQFTSNRNEATREGNRCKKKRNPVPSRRIVELSAERAPRAVHSFDVEPILWPDSWRVNIAVFADDFRRTWNVKTNPRS
jgi:hypothetical protein